MGRKLIRRGAAAVGAMALLIGSIGSADAPQLPSSKGTWHKGKLETKLVRGGSVPDELVIMTTPDNCAHDIKAEVKWDEEENEVTVHLTGQRVLFPQPTVYRTEGVDFFPNAFWPEPKDVVGGRYQLWLIMETEPFAFYYSATTLQLLGSEFDFETPPENAIVLHLPAFYATATDFIQPDAEGNVDFTQKFQYDAIVRGDLPQYSHIIGSFIPHTLCKANPYRYDQTSTRPWVAKAPRPASEARPFSDYLRSGIIFDMTVEPAEYYVFPPVSTNIATYSQAMTIGGAVPRGWTADLEALFGNLAPPIRPWEGAGSCQNWFKPKRDRDFNICGPH